MIDVFNIPDGGINIQKFYNSNNDWQTWLKPKGAKMVYILCIGGGGGGGSGFGGATDTTRGGGGGGTGSGVGKLSTIADIIPDILYVNVASGGTGGALSANGTAGGISAVSLISAPQTTAILNSSSLLRSGQAGGGFGGAGTAIGIGNAGGGGTLPLVSTCYFAQTGTFIGNNGGIGGAGGSHLGANGVTISWTFMTTGGAGGAGIGSGNTEFTGGSITSLSTVLPLIAGGSSGQTGNGGYSYMDTLMFQGGGGGGSSNTDIGGGGGHGGIGSGGGGGGAGLTGGTGGNGGGGFVMIITTT